MITLITGMPGNGKTLRAVHMLVELIKSDRDAKKSTSAPLRDYFTDVEGFDFDAVEALTGCRVQPAPDDWRETPPGSVIVYDEAHRRFPSTGRPGRSENPIIRDMDTHRHGGYDIVLITQWPTKIHHEIRSLVGSHVHMHRSMGLEAAGVLTWGRVQLDPYDEKQREKAEEEIWRFPREIYPLYKSATLHTASHKFRMPKKFWSALSVLFAIIMVLWLGYVFVLPDSVTATDSTRPAAETESASALGLLPQSAAVPADKPLALGIGAFQQLNTERVPTLAGCVASDRGCRCFSTDGMQIDLDDAQCRYVIERPLPFNIYHEYKQPVSAAVLQPSMAAVAPPVSSASPASAASVPFGELHRYGALELAPVDK
jgi:hypothetical protein